LSEKLGVAGRVGFSGADLIASLTAGTGIELATAHQIARRLGYQAGHA
jgi:hypothetical protein